tara:strand:- start:8746 stop:9252 length:507 start_codon:yes stop_codon:yes gene_type:complete
MAQIGKNIKIHPFKMNFNQRVAIMIDGNNIGISASNIYKKPNLMVNFDDFVPEIIGDRQLSNFYYFKEGKDISHKFAERIRNKFYGTVVPCHKSADMVLVITAIQIMDKIDTLILFSGDQDYLPLIKFLKSKGIRVEIASFEKTTSKLLYPEIDYHFNITEKNLFQFK